jgi:LytS/YehU family sensor histidine kinase
MNDFIRNAPEAIKFPQPFEKAPGAPMEDGKFFRPRLPQGMFFLLFAFLTFSSAVRIFQKLKREEDINHQYQREKLNAELMLLRQQVNPHFLFNSLNNIHSLANQKSDLTSEAIMKLSAILRYMLSENPSNEIPLTREVSLIENYIELQKLWMKNAITVDFRVDSISENYCIEPFILNPLVENAFKYGAFQGMESSISIHLHMIADWLYVEIINPVIREKLSEVGSMGIGLNNVIRRLELCYSGNYQIENARKGTNYQINLSIKLRNNELHSN